MRLSRAQLVEEWALYKYEETKSISTKFSTMLRAQERALHHLKLENEDLYHLAVQVGAYSGFQ